MTDKTMVADTLAGINGELVRYGEMIPQTENPQLKQVLKQMRNQCEMSQEEIYQIARAKSYYVPAALRQTGRSGSRTVSTDTALCAVKVYRTAGS